MGCYIIPTHGWKLPPTIGVLSGESRQDMLCVYKTISHIVHFSESLVIMIYTQLVELYV